MHKALYYPSIKFEDETWLKAMVLYWDKIARIVPFDLIGRQDHRVDPSKLSGEAEQLLSANQRLEDILTVEYHQESARLFKRRLEYIAPLIKELRALRADDDSSRGYTMYPQKMLHSLLNQLIEEGFFMAPEEDVIRVNSVIGHYYMQTLAEVISADRKIPLITDSPFDWSSLNIISLAADIGSDSGTADSDPGLDTAQLMNVTISGLIPKGIDKVPLKDVISFSNEHYKDRRKFMDLVSSFSSKLRGETEVDIVEMRVKEFQEDVRDSLKRLREDMDELNLSSLKGFEGKTSFTVPANWTAIGSSIGIAGVFDLGAGVPIFTAATALGIDIVGAHYKRRAAKRDMLAKLPESYLYHLENRFDRGASIRRSTSYKFFVNLANRIS